MRKVQDGVVSGIADLIAKSPESASLAHGIAPRQAAVLVFQGLHGQMLDEILRHEPRSASAIRHERSEILRLLLTLLFPTLATTPTKRKAD